MTTLRELLAVLALVWLAGCASAPTEVAGAGMRAMREHPERLIVVAVANPKAHGSVVAGSTAAG